MADLNRNFFDALARTYDVWLDGLHRRVALTLAEMVQPGPGESVLDVGCGTGLFSHPVARAVGPTGHVVAIDAAASMLDMARRSPSPNTSYFHATVDGPLWFRDGAFGLIAFCDSLTYLASPRQALQEAARMLAPGGRLALAVPCRSLATAAQETSRRVLERALQRQPLTVPPPHGPNSLLGEPDHLLRALNDVGLDRCVFRTFVSGQRASSSEDWLDIEQTSSPRAYVLLSSIGPVMQRTLADRIDEEMERLGDERYRHHQAYTLAVAWRDR
ncbi:MAG TPA: methyltransferase domain-containing protein [Candidatus Dormibacteraeota bacterium]|jgi:SAM-dependent methyltransferase|nr:methyltransferase domain-containing protein [Candidatus Dormibacteraeota bacterium]